AIQLRHHNIQYNQVEIPLQSDLQSFFSIIGQHNLITFTFQVIFKNLCYRTLVICNENAFCHVLTTSFYLFEFRKMRRPSMCGKPAQNKQLAACCFLKFRNMNFTDSTSSVTVDEYVGVRLCILRCVLQNSSLFTFDLSTNYDIFAP